MMQTLLSKRFSALRARIFGQVLEPSDPEFDKTIQGWSLGHRRHPAVMVIAKDTVNVIEAVRFAKTNSLKLAVQATGHGFVRDAKDGLLLNVSRLNAVSVDPVAQTATFQPGATWAQVLEAAHEHGLVGLVGDTPSVGAIGFVLGGGTGWFSRLYGMGVDSLLEVRHLGGAIAKVSDEASAFAHRHAKFLSNFRVLLSNPNETPRQSTRKSSRKSCKPSQLATYCPILWSATRARLESRRLTQV